MPSTNEKLNMLKKYNALPEWQQQEVFDIAESEEITALKSLKRILKANEQQRLEKLNNNFFSKYGV